MNCDKVVFTPITEIEDHYTAVKFAICGYEAVDTKNQLALFTTNGHVRNGRKWFVQRYKLPSGRIDTDQPHFMFRASHDKVMQRLTEPKIQNQIARILAAALKPE